MLIVEPKTNGIAINCFNDCIHTLTSLLGRNHEMIYSEKWGFEYNSGASLKASSFGSRIGMGATDDEVDQFMKYHGIQLTRHVFEDKNSIIDLLENELSLNHPIIIGVDCYFIPWDPGYRIHHSDGHSFIVTGLDRKQAIVFASDGFFLKKDKISIANILDGFRFCYTYSVTGCEMELDWRASVKDFINKVKPPHQDQSIFQAMRLIASDWEDIFSTEYGRDNFKSVIGDEFAGRLIEIAINRERFGLTIKLLAEKYHEDELLPIAEEFKMAADFWHSLRGMVIKASLASDIDRLALKPPIKFRQIADFEEKVADKLLRLSNSIKINKTVMKERIGSTNSNYSRIVPLNLNNHFNSKVFVNTFFEQCPDNILENDLFILADSKAYEQEWLVDGVKFSFPKLADGGYDNICCRQNMVEVPEDDYKKIMFLGGAVWGTAVDEFSIVYTDGYIDKINIEFVDYFSWNASDKSFNFKDKIAWVGQSADLIPEEKKLKVMNGEARIYKCVRDIPRNGTLKYIQLPDCPNMHIFAITLCK